MKNRMRVLTAVWMAAVLAGFQLPAADEEFPPPCDPVPVKKPVTMVRREITVSIIGVARPPMPANRRPSLDSCVAYWTRAMDREIANAPDLVVLPEDVDSWAGATPAEKLDWVRRRGDRLLKAFQAYARDHHCYLVFNSYRQRKDGRFANCTYALDRDGDVVAVYDKVYPTPDEIEWKELPIVPGEGPVAVETDFGRLAFATCFDLNFRDLLMATAALKPDVIAFCSAYNGDFWQRTWSYTCRSYLIGCTVGTLAKDVSGPSGEALFHSHTYFQTATVKINTNYRVCHLDHNWAGLQKAVDKYGPRVTVRNPGAVGCVTLLSNDPELKAGDVVKEFGLEEWDDYYARSVRTREAAMSEKTLTMMSFNIRMGCGLKDPFRVPEGGLAYLPACAEVIKAANPDWVAIQEIDRCSKRAGHVDQTAELARLCGLHGTFVKKVPQTDGDYGLAILSKEKPIGVSKILMPGSSHTRCVEIVEFKDYVVACTHFPLKEEFRVRAAEIVRLNLTDRAKPVFLAGDLNAEPESPEIAELKKGFTVLTDTAQPTFRADNPTKCIDYIMVDTAHADRVEVLSRKVIAAPEATDHCALVVTANLKK